MHSALKVAQCLLGLARASGGTLTPMQMLKLVYICHGWMLGLYQRPLIRDEVQAWKFGPVIPPLYHAIKQYRSNPIGQIPVAGESELDPLERDLVDQVFNIYGHLDGITLSSLTHQPNTPWALTYRSDARGVVISNDLIQSHYAGLSAPATAATAV